jgi:hypothetical protein
METIVSILAVYGISKVLTEGNGPGGSLYKLRCHIEALNCFMCTSVWVASIIALFTYNGFAGYILVTAALFGGAIIINEVINVSRIK